MIRRQFITLFGSAAAAWPIAARAQQSAMPVIGFLRDCTAAGSEFMVNGLRKGLLQRGRSGWVAEVQELEYRR